MIYAVDKRTGKIKWERVAFQGQPIDKRHIKSTYANSTPATDGRIVVAWFKSQGAYAYDVNGKFLWKVDVGRLDLGAYDIPTYEWGPASSPCRTPRPRRRASSASSGRWGLEMKLSLAYSLVSIAPMR